MKKLFGLVLVTLLISACSLQFLDRQPGKLRPVDLGPSWTTFQNDYFEIAYPLEWKIKVSGDNVTFSAPDAKQEVVALVMQDIPRVALPDDLIEDTYWGKLYHDTDAKTGTEKIDKLITDLPGSSKDFYLAGYGEVYDKMLESLQLHEQDETITVSVYFANNNAEVFTPLPSRAVDKNDKYRAALQAVMAGPNESEQVAGAINLFDPNAQLDDVQVENGIARVYFSGNLCSIPGAAFNQGTLVAKTLEQFSEVKAVKIYLDGETEDPDSSASSIPTCLEP